jgi:hypothetical protein
MKFFPIINAIVDWYRLTFLKRNTGSFVPKALPLIFEMKRDGYDDEGN